MLSSAEIPASLVDSLTLAACSEAVAAASRIAAATACIAASSPVVAWAAVPAAICSSSPLEGCIVQRGYHGPARSSKRAGPSDKLVIRTDNKDQLPDDRCRSQTAAVNMRGPSKSRRAQLG